jgi:hypothetical protein
LDGDAGEDVPVGAVGADLEVGAVLLRVRADLVIEHDLRGAVDPEEGVSIMLGSMLSLQMVPMAIGGAVRFSLSR